MLVFVCFKCFYYRIMVSDFVIKRPKKHTMIQGCTNRNRGGSKIFSRGGADFRKVSKI